MLSDIKDRERETREAKSCPAQLSNDLSAASRQGSGGSSGQKPVLALQTSSHCPSVPSPIYPMPSPSLRVAHLPMSLRMEPAGWMSALGLKRYGAHCITLRIPSAHPPLPGTCTPWVNTCCRMGLQLAPRDFCTLDTAQSVLESWSKLPKGVSSCQGTTCAGESCCGDVPLLQPFHVRTFHLLIPALI